MITLTWWAFAAALLGAALAGGMGVVLLLVLTADAADAPADDDLTEW